MSKYSFWQFECLKTRSRNAEWHETANHNATKHEHTSEQVSLGCVEPKRPLNPQSNWMDKSAAGFYRRQTLLHLRHVAALLCPLGLGYLENVRIKKSKKAI